MYILSIFSFGLSEMTKLLGEIQESIRKLKCHNVTFSTKSVQRSPVTKDSLSMTMVIDKPYMYTSGNVLTFGHGLFICLESAHIKYSLPFEVLRTGAIKSPAFAKYAEGICKLICNIHNTLIHNRNI